MLKIRKVILWTLFGCMCLLTIIAGSIDIGIDASKKDNILYHIGGALIFVIIGIGILIELNKSMLKNSSVKFHVKFWLIIMFISIIPFIVCYSLSSNKFKQNIKNKNSNETTLCINSTEEETQTQSETTQNNIESEEITTMGSQHENETKEETTVKKETKIDSTEEETQTPECKELSEDTIKFSNQKYEINGIEIVFNSISFDKNYKPSGYRMTLNYTVINNGSNNALFEFCQDLGKFTCKDGTVPLVLSALNSTSNSKAAYVNLNVGQTITKDVELNAISTTYETRIKGVSYPKTSIGDIFNNEHFDIEIAFTGSRQGCEQSSEVNLTFN